jgi:hypothetical protein
VLRHQLGAHDTSNTTSKGKLVPTIDHTAIDGLIAHTQREPFGTSGHLGTTVYINDRVDVYAAKSAGGKITINIGGSGGSSSLSFSPGQWDLIFAHVNAIRERVQA